LAALELLAAAAALLLETASNAAAEKVHFGAATPLLWPRPGLTRLPLLPPPSPPNLSSLPEEVSTSSPSRELLLLGSLPLWKLLELPLLLLLLRHPLEL
jgi:hypothetical protein